MSDDIITPSENQSPINTSVAFWADNIPKDDKAIFPATDVLPKAMVQEDIEEWLRDIENTIEEIKPIKGANFGGYVAQNDRVFRQRRFLINFVLFRGNQSKACRVTNISRERVRAWLQKHKEFKRVYNDIKDNILDLAEQQLHRHVEQGTMAAISMVLKTRGRDRGYGETVKHEHTIEDFDAQLIKGRERALNARNITPPIDVSAS